MGFLNELVSEFTHQGQGQGGGGGQQQQQQQYGGGQQGYGGGQQQYGGQQQQYGGGGGGNGPPPVSPPWMAEWDGRDNRWLFINQQTGERTFNYPGPGQSMGAQGGYGGNQGQYNQGSYNPTQGNQQKQGGGGNAWKYAAAGGVGLVGGALAVHEGEKIHKDWDREEDRIDNDERRWKNDVEDAPDNVANWAGQEVGRADRFGDRVDQKFDNAVNDVEDFPEDAARWTGNKVQEVEDIPQDVDNDFRREGDRIENRFDNDVDRVENFDNNVDNAFDQGRDERRYDDGDY